jgi:hypothetical protein
MSLLLFETYIKQTLLYYEIFDHPLTANELFILLPQNSLTRQSFHSLIEDLVHQNKLRSTNGFYQLYSNHKDLSSIRHTRQKLAKKRFMIAKNMSYIMRIFPFVRGIFVSGDLSKGVASPMSDIDYVIVTAPKRLWICRTLLICFKKIFLLNKRKYFCLNFFVSEDNMKLDEKNYYTATEIAHLKPLYNENLFLNYMNANSWIKEFFPNYSVSYLATIGTQHSLNLMQKFFELLFFGSWADALDAKLMNLMRELWKKRYPEYDTPTQERIFRSNDKESRAFIGNFSDKVLSRYNEKLKENNLS